MNAFGTIANTGTIRFERLFQGPAERVWDYLTRPELMATWLAEGEIQLRVGGYVELRFNAPKGANEKSGTVISGVVTHFQPPESLAYYWTDANTISNVIFEIEKRGQQVALLLTHARLPKPFVSTSSASWHARLDILEEQLQNRPSSSFPVLYESLVPHYEL